MQYKALIGCLLGCVLTYLGIGALLQTLNTCGAWPPRRWGKSAGLVSKAGFLGRPSWVPKDAFVVDMHTHTNASGDGKLSPEQLITLAIANGYNGIAITDHNTTANVAACRAAAKIIDPNFVIIPGYEWSNLRFHANVYGPEQQPPRKFSSMFSWPSERDVQEVSKYAKAAGGYVQYNHPGDRSCAGLRREFVQKAGFGAVEVIGGRWDIRCPSIERFCTDNKILMTGGSDTHAMRSHPRTYTQILPASDGSLPSTAADVLAAILDNRMLVFSNPALERSPGGQYAVVKGVAFAPDGKPVRTQLNAAERAFVWPWRVLNSMIPRNKLV